MSGGGEGCAGREEGSQGDRGGGNKAKKVRKQGDIERGSSEGSRGRPKLRVAERMLM